MTATETIRSLGAHPTCATARANASALEAMERTRGCAAGFLIDRKLMHGSRSTYNAEARDAAPAWVKPWFPRFYPYDVLRGLTTLVRWAELDECSIPLDAVSDVIEHLVATFPAGVVRPKRRAYVA